MFTPAHLAKIRSLMGLLNGRDFDVRHEHYVKFLMPDGYSLGFGRYSYDKADMVRVSASFPAQYDSGVSTYGVDTGHSVQVSLKREALILSRDLERRLLPVALAAHTELEARRTAVEKERETATEAVTWMETTLGTPLERRSTRLARFREYPRDYRIVTGDVRSASGKLHHTQLDLDTQPDTMSFKIHNLTRDQVLHLLRLVKTQI